MSTDPSLGPGTDGSAWARALPGAAPRDTNRTRVATAADGPARCLCPARLVLLLPAPTDDRSGKAARSPAVGAPPAGATLGPVTSAAERACWCGPPWPGTR